MTRKNTIGEIVRTARKARKWSAPMLERRCKVSADTICKFERGQSNDIVEKAIRMIVCIGLDPREVFDIIMRKERERVSVSDGEAVRKFDQVKDTVL